METVTESGSMSYESSLTNHSGAVFGKLRHLATSGLLRTPKPANYNRDLYECEREATLAGGHDNKQQLFHNCMKARGTSRSDRL
jgi:hypothetical protein